MKQACEYVHGIFHNLIMMIIPVKDPKYVYGDNHYVLANTKMPKLTLNKKSNANAFHFVQEGSARVFDLSENNLTNMIF